jgi:hypothetical protein
MKGGGYIPDTASDGKLALSAAATLGAAGDERVGLTAQGDDASDFQNPRTNPVIIFFKLLSPDMALWMLCRQGKEMVCE